MKTITFILIFILALNKIDAQDLNLEQIKEKYRKEILKTMKKKGIIGASLILVDKNKILWSEGFGYRDKEKQLIADENTVYGIGSVTKVFTATAIMQLKDQGKLNLNDPLHNHLPEFKIKGKGCDEITLKNLLCHHSGLPSDVFKGMFSDQPEDYKQVVNYINKEQIALKPNTIRAYSNPGFTLLGHAIQKITKSEYNQFINKNIFSPLKMKASHFNGKAPNLSLTFNKNGENKKDVLLRDIPAGGMYSNTKDLAKYVQAILNNSDKLLTEDSYNEMFKVVNKEVALDFGNEYGLSWSTSVKNHVGRVWTHTGTTLYYNAAIGIAREAGLGVIILTNSENGGWLFGKARGVLSETAKLMGYNFHEKEEQKKTEITSSKKRIKLSKSDLESYKATYVTPGVVIPLKVKGKKLKTKITGIKAELIPVAKNTFIPKPFLFGFIPIKLGNMRFYFEEVDGYQVITQLEKGSTKELLAVKYEEQKFFEEWNLRKGKYSLANKLQGDRELIKNFEIKEVSGVLCLTFNLKGDKNTLSMALDTKSAKLAQVAGLGRYAGTTIEVTGQNTIRAFGYELKKI